MARPSLPMTDLVAGDTESAVIVFEGRTLAGETWTSEVRPYAGHTGTPLAVGAVNAVQVGADAEVTVTWTPAQTRLLGGQTLVWDLQEDAAGTITTHFAGSPWFARLDVTE